MSITLTIRDETTAGNVYAEIPLQFVSERISVRDLIRERVYQEVQDFNLAKGQVFRGLVQPTDTESILNGSRTDYRLSEHRAIDWKRQFEKACEAFSQNRFFILVDDAQADSLDQEYVIHAKSQVSFVKLTLLVGG